MKRTWELAFSETACFVNLSRVINILEDWGYSCETTSNRDGDGDYIFEIFDADGDCVWSDGDGPGYVRNRLPIDCVHEFDRVFGKSKPRVIVGDAVKLPLP